MHSKSLIKGLKAIEFHSLSLCCRWLLILFDELPMITVSVKIRQLVKKKKNVICILDGLKCFILSWTINRNNQKSSCCFLSWSSLHLHLIFMAAECVWVQYDPTNKNTNILTDSANQCCIQFTINQLLTPSMNIHEKPCLSLSLSPPDLASCLFVCFLSYSTCLSVLCLLIVLASTPSVCLQQNSLHVSALSVATTFWVD